MNLSVIVPVGLLLAIVLSLGRLYHDSEMTALQGCGFAPSRMLVPLEGLCGGDRRWACLGCSFAQVPLADHPGAAPAPVGGQRSTVRAARRGRFCSFMSGAECRFYAERVDERGAPHNVSVRRETADRIEGGSPIPPRTRRRGERVHLVTLFNGRRYEGVPGHGDFRVIEFSEHGIPIATPYGPRSTE